MGSATWLPSPAGVKISPQQVRELAPFGVLAAAADFGGERLETAEGGDLDLQLRDSVAAAVA